MTSSASNIPSEHVEQVTFLREFERLYPSILIFAIPNGGFRHKATAQKLKMEGVKKGIPDLFVPEWRLFIEMKKQKGGRLSPEQKEMIQQLKLAGYYCMVCNGYKHALEQIAIYIEQNDISVSDK